MFKDSEEIFATDATPKTEDTEAILILSVIILMIVMDSAASRLSLQRFEPEIASLNKDAAARANGRLSEHLQRKRSRERRKKP